MGRAIALSHTAADVVRRQNCLRLISGVLTAADNRSNTALQSAIHRCCRPTGPLEGPLPAVLRRPNGVVVADIGPVPCEGPSFGAGAAAILVIRRSPSHESLATTIGMAFGLTEAEANIAAQLAQGSDVQAIAGHRHASVQTVRSQLKTILSKTGARSQAQLVALVLRRD